jgi:endo-1,4-beta-xylanase
MCRSNETRGFQVLAAAGLLVFAPLQVKAQLAEGHSKFLGNIIASSVPSTFDTYWNQITPENSGKWGSVEATRDVMNWSQLDLAYNHAQQNDYPFKQHTFVWGNQEPGWIGSLSQSEQLAEVIEWIQAYGQRYPNTDLIDVVNEPLHAPASYRAALGGDNGLYGTGWDWVVRSFELARQYCPNADLLLNDYGIISDPNAAQNYRNIIDILNSRGLIDGIGIQCHAFNMDNVSVSTMNQVLGILAGAGLPIYVSELDMRGTDSEQLSRYQQKFPVLWEHSSVQGITLWGYIQGQIWQTEAYLLRSNGTERPALGWLRDFLATPSGNTHVWLEAECGTKGSLWNTVSSGTASNGSYVTIQSGNNSTGSAPTNTNGHINFPFSVSQSGNYVLWCRVIAPTGNDDSFWIRMDGGSWINWNNIAPGSTSWTWDDVQSFNLSSGNHTLTVAYREDGAQLDKLYLTNSGSTPSGTGSAASNCSTNQPPNANAGNDQTVTDSDGNGSQSVSLNGSGSNDPDGSITSYVWTEGANQIATGATPAVTFSVGVHNVTLTVTDNNGAQDTDNVTITVNAGSSNTVWLEAECGARGSLWNVVSSGTASNGSYVTIQAGNNSTGSAPTNTNGHINFTFSVTSGNYIVWGRVITPNANDDSFWIRMDGGSWIMWNSIAPGSSWHWDEVHNSNSGGQVVNFNLSSGSHTLTVAYREDGTQLDKIYITSTGATPSGTGSAATNCSGSRVAFDEPQDETDADLELAANESVPTEYSLSDNYPNPFNPATKITYTLKDAADVKLEVFDIAGRLVATLADGRQTAGAHEVSFDARSLASGIYFYRLHAGSFTQTKRMLLVK